MIQMQYFNVKLDIFSLKIAVQKGQTLNFTHSKMTRQIRKRKTIQKPCKCIQHCLHEGMHDRTWCHCERLFGTLRQRCLPSSCEATAQ